MLSSHMWLGVTVLDIAKLLQDFVLEVGKLRHREGKRLVPGSHEDFSTGI